MQAVAAVAVAVINLVSACQAADYRPCLPALASRMDVIVVGRVKAVAAPAEMTFNVAGAEHKGLFRRVTVEVNDLIKDPAGKAQAAQGARKPIFLLHEKPGAAKPDPAADTANASLDLNVRERYIFLLRNIDGQGDFYLPNYYLNRETWYQDREQDTRAAADPGRWGWGPQAGGLQLACFTLFKSTTFDEKTKAPPTFRLVFALRNCTDADITVPLDGEPFQITCAGGGKEQQVNIYEKVRQGAYRIVEKTLTVPAYETAFLSYLGRDENYLPYVLPIGTGAWTLKAAFEWPTAAPTTKPGTPAKPATPTTRPSGKDPTTRPAGGLWIGRLDARSIELKVDNR